MDGLRKLGCTVQSISNIGGGCPDLLVGYRCVNYLLELKDPCQPKSGRELTIYEKEWHTIWNGQVCTVETLNDACRVLGIGIR